MPVETIVTPQPNSSSAPAYTRIQDGGGASLAGVRALVIDGLPADNTLATEAFGVLLNGSNFDRFRSASAANLIAQSGLGAALVAPPGMWTAVSVPAQSSQATVTRAPGGTGVRHVAWRWKVSEEVTTTLAGAVSSSGALRDGTSGTGTLIDAQFAGLNNTTVGTAFVVGGEANLNIIGSTATAMTAETAGALTGVTQGSVLVGYDAS